jgi:hypothetical protein
MKYILSDYYRIALLICQTFTAYFLTNSTGICPTDPENCPFGTGICPNRFEVVHMQNAALARVFKGFSQKTAPSRNRRNYIKKPRALTRCG